MGFEINDWGTVNFDYMDVNKPEEIIPLQWSPFKKSDSFTPSKKEFMINYRVQNLEGILIQLKEKGVTILDEIVTYEGIGNFYISWMQKITK